jgi:hypothetical protein
MIPPTLGHRTRARDRDETSTTLASQTDTLRDLGLDIRITVVCIPRPVKSERIERPAKSREPGPTSA